MAYNTGAYKIQGGDDGTRVRLVPGLVPSALPLQAREAFAVAYHRLRELARTARDPVVLVAAVDAQARLVKAVILQPGHSLTIGRHSHCGLRLPDDTVSLRQLVAYVPCPAPDAAPAIQLWDLNTTQPFITEDGQPNAAVLAEGMLYASVGPYAFLFVPTRGSSEPSWPESAAEAWKALPPREFRERRTPTAARLQHARRMRKARHEDYTPIHRVGPLLLLGQEEGPQDAWGELVLQSRGTKQYHRISLSRLEQGVLLGRYERCGIPLADIVPLSRVHLILVRMGEDVLAIDTGSTNGTWRGRTRLETTTLEDSDSLVLAMDLHLRWRRLSSEATRKD
jgi:hypothetical protein